MAKINQIIAIEKGVKSQTHSAISELHKINKKSELFNGLDKQYTPKNEEGEQFPPERKRVQYMVAETLKEFERKSSDLMQITARKDWSNTKAAADVVVDGITIIEQAPISYLLFLEKQIENFRTFVAELPVLDPAEKWSLDADSGLRKSEAVVTQKTAKLQEPIVLYDATDKHPAQTEIITKDVVIGHWTTTKHSGAMALTEKKKLAERVEKLFRAIKEAREAANTLEEVLTPDIGARLFGYLMPETTE